MGIRAGNKDDSGDRATCTGLTGPGRLILIGPRQGVRQQLQAIRRGGT